MKLLDGHILIIFYLFYQGHETRIVSMRKCRMQNWMEYTTSKKTLWFLVTELTRIGFVWYVIVYCFCSYRDSVVTEALNWAFWSKKSILYSNIFSVYDVFMFLLLLELVIKHQICYSYDKKYLPLQYSSFANVFDH